MRIKDLEKQIDKHKLEIKLLKCKIDEGVGVPIPTLESFA